MFVSLALFLVGGWGLARDIDLDARLRAAETRAVELTRAAEAAELLALRAHLDPHFLFNTLNAIAEWCLKDGAVAEEAVLKLSAMLRTLLDGVNFDAVAGEVVAVIGPNGAGKTTLLEAVTGLRETQRGAVAFRGAALLSLPERARTFAFLPDNAELPSELCVRDVVAHALSFRPRATDFIQEIGRSLEIDVLNETPAGILSRGERQRVALFCALAVERPVVILDEPFSAFDPLKLREVLAVVRRVASSGSAVVATVHHLGDAARIADRILILSEGRSIAWGDLPTLRESAGVPGGTLDDVFVAILSRRDDAA